MHAAPRRSLHLLAAALACGLAACVSASGPGRDDLAAVRSGDRAVVLLRVLVTSNAGPVPAFDGTLESECLSVGLSDPEDGGRVTQVSSLDSFDDATLRDGWLTFVLAPGAHDVAVESPTMWDPRGEERWDEAAHWRFVVPQGAPVVYVGTLQVHCRAEASDFGGVRLRRVVAQRLHDQSDEARALAAAHLPDLPPPASALAERRHARESTILDVR